MPWSQHSVPPAAPRLSSRLCGHSIRFSLPVPRSNDTASNLSVPLPPQARDVEKRLREEAAVNIKAAVIKEKAKAADEVRF